MKFANLKGAEVSAQSKVRYTFLDIEGEPWIEVRPAGETNKPYFNAVLKRQAANRRRLVRGQVDEAMLSRSRTEDRELYPQHVLTGAWGGWKDESGNDIPCTPEAMRELMQQLPDYQFDGLRSFCNEPTNFRADAISAADADSTAGNS